MTDNVIIEVSGDTTILDITQNTIDIIQPSKGVTTHSLLNGLQGGITNEYYHLTQSRANKVALFDSINSITTGTADNDKFATQGYIDDQISSSLNIENGTANGQMLFWDNGSSIYRHSETSEIAWSDTNKTLGIGDQPPTNTSKLYVKDTRSVAGSFADNSGEFTIDVTHATGFQNQTLGLVSNILNSSGASIGSSVAVAGTVKNLSTGTIAAADCFQGLVLNQGSGTITTAKVIQTAIFATAGSIGTGYGIHIDAPFGNIGTAYGLYIGQHSVATTNWAIYTAGATQSYFGGSVGWNTTTPRRRVDILDVANPQIRWTHTDNSVYGEVQALSTGISLFSTTGAGFQFGVDNKKVLLGTSADMSIYYDGTNAIINPKEVGSGILDVFGIIQSDGYNSSDGTAGVTGSFLDQGGNTIAVKNGLVTAFM